MQYLATKACPTTIYGIYGAFSQLWLHNSKVIGLTPSFATSLDIHALVSDFKIACPSHQMEGGFFMARQGDLEIRLNDAVDEFHVECGARRLTLQTRRGYNQKLGVLQKWCAEQDIIYLPELSHRHLRRFFMV